MTAVEKLLKTAEAEVGYLEKETNKNLDSKMENAGDENYTKYARDFDKTYTSFYNGKKNGFAWCDMFVDWCFVKTFGEALALKLLGQPKKSCGAGCKFSADYFKKINRFYKSPKVGDQIFFKNSSDTPCHTGLVYKVDSTYVYTIEGNTSSAAGVVANGGAVAKKKYKINYASIYGYGRPDYSLAESKTTTSKPAATTQKVDAAQKKDNSLAGRYKVTASSLHIRAGAGVTKKSLGTLKNGTIVTNYGYYSVSLGSKWLYVKTSTGVVGFCSSKYLKKC